MTTGAFVLRPIDSIHVARESRQRRDLINIPELAESIARHGLIHPVLIDREFNLIAGERRLEACKSLSWTHIQCQFTDEADAATLQELELEENIRRADISWQDQCLAIDRYHKLRLAAEPTWTQSDTAAALNIKQQTVADKLQVSSELQTGNSRVVAAPKYSVAKGIVARDRERRSTAKLAAITGAPKESSILTADFTTWEYAGDPFNFIHCDFPYGIGAGDFDQGSASAHGGYDDGPEIYSKLLDRLDNCCRTGVVTASAHLMFWFSMKHYTFTLDALSAMGWWIDPTPLTWQKSDNTGILADPSRRPRYVTEFCFYGSRGDRKIVQAVANGISAPTEQGGHMSVKPQAVLRHFMRMFVDDTTNALDPTCGSGSAVKAVRALGGTALGLEILPDFADIARRNVDGD